MVDWLGGLLAHSPLWLIVFVAALVGAGYAIVTATVIGLELKGRRSEWWQQQYGKKKKEQKYGKK